MFSYPALRISINQYTSLLRLKHKLYGKSHISRLLNISSGFFRSLSRCFLTFIVSIFCSSIHERNLSREGEDLSIYRAPMKRKHGDKIHRFSIRVRLFDTLEILFRNGIFRGRFASRDPSSQTLSIFIRISLAIVLKFMVSEPCCSDRSSTRVEPRLALL